jgi:hypothetical protein
MLKFDFLIPTHNTLRDKKSVKPIVDFIKDGRVFRCADKPIAITQFQDGAMYIRDGHRRLTAMILAGARGLLDCEYVIEQMRYEQYNETNSKAGWVTPFDPRTECRLPDFYSFKSDAINITKWPVYIEQDIQAFCISGAHRYKEARTVYSLRDLVKVNFPNGCN